jgi:Zn-dependent protease
MLVGKMRSTADLGRYFGFRLRLHYTWFIAFILITTIVVTQFSEAYPLWQRIGLGLAASLLFAVAIVIREYILSFAAIIKGIPVKRVTLFIFGGLSQVTEEVTLPVHERLQAVVGLLSNLVITGAFYGVLLVLVNTGDIIVAGVIQWFVFIFFLLALFHFVPGLPLDGGRLLRAVLWGASGDYRQSTRITSWIGQSMGWLFVIGGLLLLVLGRQWFVGLVLAFAGWVLQIAATQSRREMLLLEILQSITVQDIMTREYPIINRELSLGQLVQDRIIVTGQRNFIIVDGARLEGMVMMRDIKRVPRKLWDSTPVGEIMTPASRLRTVQPQQPIVSVLEQMEEQEIDQIPVLERDEVIGVIFWDNLIRLVKTRTELGM